MSKFDISIKKRLLAMVLGTIISVWLGVAAFTYFDARHELDEVLDAHLAQAASLLVAQATHELDEIDTEHAPALHKYSRQVSFQIWDKDGQLRLHSSNAPQESLANNQDSHAGFSTNDVNGQRWRVFSTWDASGEFLIHVAELADVRKALALNVVFNLLLPLLVALPLLAILLWLAVTNGLKPLVNLASEVAQRAPDNLSPLEAIAAPREVLPLIERLNELFDRIVASMENERRFTADAAHELRTPVAAIKAQGQVALGAADSAERTRALNNVILGCDRATHLIEQLLILARLDSAQNEHGNGQIELCQLHELAIESVADIAPAALNKGVQIEFIGGENAVIQGIPGLLRIMLRNLIENAVRHTPSGTLVSVQTLQKGSKASIIVSDNGSGMSDDEISKVSHRFYRPLGTKASGSGLGLSIVKRIADIHGAKMQLTKNADGSGLRVTINF